MKLLRVLLATVLVSLGVLLPTSSAEARKVSYAQIEGSGSTWSYLIVQQWIANVASSGMQVTYNNNGSSLGRKDFANSVTDFGISEIPYQGTDPVTHQADNSNGRAYAYLPIVAGGTAFTYHLEIAGQLVRNLRLSGLTLAKIFTNQITMWNDPEIKKDNNGRSFPPVPITPVVRSDGSGTTAQFTRYLDTEYPSIWRPYNGHAGLTSQYPRKGRQIGASGSDQVMNTIDAQKANGTIGYVEYAYPKYAHYPVVKVENPAGYFVEPTQYNVAVALTKAQISHNPDPKVYLTQILNGVYSDRDPRAYPLSSYSYMIIPTGKSPPKGTEQRMTTAKRQTLADFLNYSLCQGQSIAGNYGYSPLPLNLVSAGFQQIAKLKQADPGVTLTNRSLTQCHNPTFVAGHLSENHLAQIAPLPASCDKAGAGPCGFATGTGVPSTNNNQPKGSSTGTTSTTAGTGTTTAAAGGSAGGTSVGLPSGGTAGVPGSSTPGTTAATGAINPSTGQPVGTTTTATGGTVVANPTELTAARSNDNGVFGWVAALELLALVLIPGLYVAGMRRRSAKGISK